MADAPAVALVAAASFLETFAGMMDGRDIVDHVAAKCAPELFAGWAATDDSVVTLVEHAQGAPVGYSVLTVPDLPVEIGPDAVELRRIYTLALTRGTGLGTALMTRAVADARAMGKRRLLLGVHSGNARARALYERNGFTLAGERRFLVGRTWHDDVVYARDLAGA